MSSLVVASIAAAAALAATSLLAAVLVRARRASDRRLVAGLAAMGTRMDDLVEELERAIVKVHEDARRMRLVESLGQTLDLEETLTRCVEAAALLPGVAGALVEVDVEGARRTAAAGIETAVSGVVGVPPGSGQVRAIGSSYHYAPGEGAAPHVRSAVSAPVSADGRIRGFLTVFSRSDEHPLGGGDFESLEVIAGHAALAVEREAGTRRATGDDERDALTGLGNRSRFHEALAREAARARRHGHDLTLLVLDVDDFRRANDRLGEIEADDLLDAVANEIRSVARPADLAFRIGGDEFALILVEGARIDAEGLYARVQASLGRHRPAPGTTLSVSAGIAQLQRGDDGLVLFARAEQALRIAKEAGKGTAA